jgi:hypothetical protein
VHEHNTNSTTIIHTTPILALLAGDIWIRLGTPESATCTMHANKCTPNHAFLTPCSVSTNTLYYLQHLLCIREHSSTWSYFTMQFCFRKTNDISTTINPYHSLSLSALFHHVIFHSQTNPVHDILCAHAKRTADLDTPVTKDVDSPVTNHLYRYAIRTDTLH